MNRLSGGRPKEAADQGATTQRRTKQPQEEKQKKTTYFDGAHCLMKRPLGTTRTNNHSHVFAK